MSPRKLSSKKRLTAEELASRKLLTDEELAPAIGIKVDTINRLRRTGVILYVKLGYRTLRYNQEAVEAALMRREIKARGTRGTLGATTRLLTPARLSPAYPTPKNDASAILEAAQANPNWAGLRAYPSGTRCLPIRVR